jgi:hypothetical protein
VLSRNGDQGSLPTMPNSGGQVGSEVTYKLTAKVNRTLRAWKDEVELNFTPARGVATPDPAFTEIRENCLEHKEKYRVDDFGEPRAVTTKDGLKNVFRRHNTTKKTIKVSSFS